MSSAVIAPDLSTAVAHEAIRGLTSNPKTLAPWLFYDEAGSNLFERITELPEYYLTRTERAIFAAHADEILTEAAGSQRLTLIELGAGTATKTGLLLAAAVRRQKTVLYQPIDVSETALDEARRNIEAHIPGVAVVPQAANYVTEPLHLERPPKTRILALYIGSSIGNFDPAGAREVLANLHVQLRPGDSLLLGTDLAPSLSKSSLHKSVPTLLAAYNDAAGVTAAFNRNILTRLNRELGTDFRPECFTHEARWNARDFRIEMHLRSTVAQRVHLPATGTSPSLRIDFAAGETIHTENSYKFTPAAIASLLEASGFTPTRAWHDPNHLFAVTLVHAS